MTAEKVVVSRIRYRGIEQPCGRSYSSRQIEVEAEIPPGTSAARAVDLLDQAVARRLGVKPLRQELAEREVDRLERRKEEADRAARRLPESEVTIQKGRQRVLELDREAERLLGEHDAAELADKNRPASSGPKRKPKEYRTPEEATAAQSVQEIKESLDLARQRARQCRENLEAFEREHAGLEERARSSPHPTEIEESRKRLRELREELERSIPDLPL